MTMNSMAKRIMEQKYLWKEKGETKWEDIALRVASNVHANSPDDIREGTFKAIADRDFIPGGRYLYASGRGLPQVNNCFSGNTRILTRNGVDSLKSLEGKHVEVRAHDGKWHNATVRKFGTQQLYRIKLENNVEIYATKDHRWVMLDGSVVTTENLTSIPFSVSEEYAEIDPEGVRHGIIFGDGYRSNHDRYSSISLVNPEKAEVFVPYFPNELKEIAVGSGAKRTYNTVRLENKYPKIALQPAHYKNLPTEYSPEYARGFIQGLISADGCVGAQVTISAEGLSKAQKIAEIAVAAGCVVTSVRVTNRVNPFNGKPRELCAVAIKPFSAPPMLLPSHRSKMAENLRKMKMTVKVTSIEPTDRVEEVYCAVVPGPNSFTLANGLITGNCMLFDVEDSREGWANLSYRAEMALMTGAGIGVVYSKLRPKGSPISNTGGFASGPVAKMMMINEIGRQVMQGGSRRSAIWAGLHWWHPDVFEFMEAKQWSPEVRAAKEKDFNAWAPLDMTNISIILDTRFRDAVENPNDPDYEHASEVMRRALHLARTTGEPGFSIDIDENDGEHLRNAPVSGNTHVLTDKGYRKVIDIVDTPSTVWTGKQWAAEVVFTKTADNVPVVKVDMTGGRTIVADPSHEFFVERYKGAGKNRKLVSVDRVAAGDLCVGDTLHVSLPETVANEPDKSYRANPVKVLSVEPAGSEDVYCADVKADEHSFQAEGVIISNCTEVVSRDDSDICNLGSVNWANMRDLDHFRETLKIATWTLVAGTIYSALPFKEVEKVVEKNRRIGVGIMGLAEWAATRGLPYDASSTLRQWLRVYREVTEVESKRAADYFEINVPVKTRAVAPAGTISIMAETTSGIEPVYAVAYKRRNLVNGIEWQASYEIDQAAQRLIDRGVDPDSIPTALNLAEDIEPVLRLLAEVSDYVDQSVSKTVNLPSVEDQERLGITDESLMRVVMKYIFRYRGLTFYPDGARGGQPIVPVSYQEAVNRGNAVFTEIGNEMSCSLDGVCGT